MWVSWLVFVTAVTGAVAAADCSAGPLGCLQSDLERALRKIGASREFRLLPGLAFRRLANATDDGAPREDDGGPETRGLTRLFARTERLFDSHALYWTFLPGVDIRVARGPRGDFGLSVQKSAEEGSSRTFGVMRRLKMALLPIMYKLGVITTLLTLLTVFALKGLTIGVVLLVLTSAGLLAKLKHWHGHGHGHGQDYYGGGAGWEADYFHHPPPHKDVHIHVHGAQLPYMDHHYPGADHWHRAVEDEQPPASASAVQPRPPYYDPYGRYSAPKWKYLPDYSY